MRASLEYKFCCAYCAFEYVGSTTRALYSRAAEHVERSLILSDHLSIIRAISNKADFAYHRITFDTHKQARFK